MKKSNRPVNAATLVALIVVTACSASTQRTAPDTVRPMIQGGSTVTPAAQAKADSGRPRYTAADVRFMQGMIGHHTQALTMVALAPTRGARPDVRILAERIGVSQRDEISLMQRWLADRNETVPDTTAHHDHAGMTMPGMTMPGKGATGGMMPGMLSPAQLTQLTRATGPDFDRLFLTFMIQHHQGAVTMVSQLLAVPGAAGNVDIYRFAADVNVDQTTEINRMRVMLAATPSGKPD